jgi:hypothetical protein
MTEKAAGCCRITVGYYLAHNHVRSSGQLGLNGFRAWVQEGRTSPELVQCTCDFGGLKNTNVNRRYRVKGTKREIGGLPDGRPPLSSLHLDSDAQAQRLCSWKSNTNLSP